MFREWQDAKKTTNLMLFVLIVFWLFIGFLYVTFPEQRGVLNWYTMMLTVALLVVAIDYKRGPSKLLAANNWGQSYKALLVALVMGAVGGYLLLTNPFSTLSVSIPYPLTTAQSFVPDWNFFYIVIASPIAETIFFVNVLAPTMISAIGGMGFRNSDLLGILATSGMFTLYHFNAYGGNIAAMLSAGAACFIWILVGYILKNNAFGLGAHISNNYIIMLARGGVLG